jgi:hypothetical protein
MFPSNWINKKKTTPKKFKVSHDQKYKKKVYLFAYNACRKNVCFKKKK